MEDDGCFQAWWPSQSLLARMVAVARYWPSLFHRMTSGLGFPQADYMRLVAMKDAAIGELVSVYPSREQGEKMILNGTTYKAPPELAQVIERCRLSGKRFRFHLGDAVTGCAWGDVEIGRIGRSIGPVKIPIVLSNRRSIGGHGLLDPGREKTQIPNITTFGRLQLGLSHGLITELEP